MAETTQKRTAWGTLSTDTIVDAALTLIEREGIDALNICSLAAGLGVGRMSIYRHVESKEELLGLAVNAVADRELLTEPSTEMTWQDELRANARQIRTQLTRYPGLDRLLLTAGALGPASKRFAEQLLGIFHRAGFRGDRLTVCYLIYIDTVLGRIYRETSSDFASNERMESFAAIDDPEHPTPILAEVAQQLSNTAPDVLFENMLDVMLDGFTAQLARS